MGNDVGLTELPRTLRVQSTNGTVQDEAGEAVRDHTMKDLMDIPVQITLNFTRTAQKAL